jgi:uncharacterized protein YndB with AHSA1/START domain
VSRVIVEQAIAAPVERIWRACTEPQGLRAWQADKVVGSVTTRGKLELGWPELGVSIALQVERVEPERTIILRSDDSRLEFHISPGKVTVEHSADFDDDTREGTRSSWQLSLATLAHYLKYHDGRPRHVHWALQRGTASLEDAHAFFTLAEAHNAWLTRRSTGIGAAGSDARLQLSWDAPLTGRVLAHTPPRDVLLSWRETNQSLLALRTLPSPESATERLLAVTWSTWGNAATAPTTAHFRAALQRLSRILERRAQA